jgi:hypothetical protein
MTVSYTRTMETDLKMKQGAGGTGIQPTLKVRIHLIILFNVSLL